MSRDPAIYPRTLSELCAACDGSLSNGGNGWTRSFHLSGTRDDRSARRLKALIAAGLAEGKKWGEQPQAQWTWRITDAGRAALRARQSPVEPGEGEKA